MNKNNKLASNTAFVPSAFVISREIHIRLPTVSRLFASRAAEEGHGGRGDIGKLTAGSHYRRPSTIRTPAGPERGLSTSHRRISRVSPISIQTANRDSSDQSNRNGGDAKRVRGWSGDEVKTPFDLAKHMFDLLFLEADVDQSGCIDSAEFGEMLMQLGRNIGPDVARHCIAR